MLILIGIVPTVFALNLDADSKAVANLELTARKTMAMSISLATVRASKKNRPKMCSPRF